MNPAHVQPHKDEYCAETSAIFSVTDASDTPSSPVENTLRGIVGRAADGDVVAFAPGISEIALREELVINKSPTIAGSSSQRVAIRQTAANFRVLSVPSGKTAVMRRLKIAGGGKTGYGNGGGINSAGFANLMLSSRVFGNTPDQSRGSYTADKTCRQ